MIPWILHTFLPSLTNSLNAKWIASPTQLNIGQHDSDSDYRRMPTDCEDFARLSKDNRFSLTFRRSSKGNMSAEIESMFVCPQDLGLKQKRQRNKSLPFQVNIPCLHHALDEPRPGDLLHQAKVQAQAIETRRDQVRTKRERHALLNLLEKDMN